MFARNLFYDSYHFYCHSSKQQINTIRKTLLTFDCHRPVNDYTSDVRIFIINPPLSSKCRSIGNIRKTKESSYQVFRFSYQFRTSYSQHYPRNAGFKPFYNFAFGSAQASFANTSVLMKVSVSYKEPNRGQCIQSKVKQKKDFPIQKKLFIPSAIEKSLTHEKLVPEEFRKKDENKERTSRLKKAYNYLRTLGEELKLFYKKDSQSGRPSEKTFESSENGIKESEVQINRHLRDLMKRCDKLKSLPKEKKITKKESDETKSNTSNSKENNNIERKIKKRKKYFHITASMSSGLSFAKRMELLAMSRIINSN